MQSGTHTVSWNGTDDDARAVASGIYFYRIQSNGSSAVKKCLLLK
jgi:flagellar hook assembly protein FlgD